MNTFQRVQILPLPDGKPPLYQPAYLTSLSPSASSSSFSSSQEDLLPDLWLESPKCNSSPTFQDFSAPSPSPWGQVMLRDESLEYAQSLLPHSLLVPLTQENLGTLDEDIFDFEEQQTQQARQHNHKLRNSSVSSASSSTKTQMRSLNTQLYKTELCMLFIKVGMCPYGNKCQFAHGKQDLKVVERPSNWRSKPCANWAKFGACRYGKRCCFKHG